MGNGVVHTPSGVLLEMPYYQGVGMGLIPTQSRVTLLGHNPSIGSGAAADVWEGGGDYPFLAAASILEVLSASASDAAAGTGGRTVLVSGLDANYNPISEIVALNGVTPVQTVNSFLRVNLFFLTSSGSGHVNAGDVTLRVTGGGTTLNIMRAGYGFARAAVYTVPVGFTLFLLSAVFSVVSPNGASVNAAVFGFFSRIANGTNRIPIEFNVTSTNPYRHDTLEGVLFAAKTDFTIRVTNTAQAATNVLAAAECVLVDNKALL